MNLNINIHRPDVVIDVGAITSINDVHNILKPLNVDNYAYIFKCQGKTMKIGYSADSSHSYGERISRQIGNLPNMPRRWSSAGKDMLEVVKEFEIQTNIRVEAKDVTVEIWNVTNINNPSFNVRYVAEQAEDTLFNQYEAIYNKLPPGNPRDTRRLKGIVAVSLFDSLFE